MFSHYFRAVGFLAIPLATGFWNGVHSVSHQLADNARRIYTGNGQTYLVHILIYMVVIYMLMFSL